LTVINRPSDPRFLRRAPATWRLHYSAFVFELLGLCSFQGPRATRPAGQASRAHPPGGPSKLNSVSAPAEPDARADLVDIQEQVASIGRHLYASCLFGS
jgi:hypothetical protein